MPCWTKPAGPGWMRSGRWRLRSWAWPAPRQQRRAGAAMGAAAVGGLRFARQHMLIFVIINKFVNGDSMAMQSSDIVPISEARARLTELAEDVVGNGAEKLLTKNGASYVALIDARRLDHYHALEEEHARLVLAADAITGLRQALASEFVADAELDDALGGGAAP